MKVVAAIDSFKGSARSKELNEAIVKAFSTAETLNLPIADGGEGTMAAIFYQHGGTFQKVIVPNALDALVETNYLITKIKNKKVGIIETASIIGINQTIPDDETTRLGSSYGVGEVLKDALKHELDKIYLTLGGTSTSDGGLGLLESLKFISKNSAKGNPLLSFKETTFEKRNLFKKGQVIALTDVTNPYTGKEGFARVFGPQKGASEKTVTLLDEKADKFQQVVKEQLKIDLNQIPGAGAAGGLGGSIALLGGELKAGFPVISELLGVEEKIKNADLIITGEGKIDAQTTKGKLPFGIGKLGMKHQVPTVAICGSMKEPIDELRKTLPIIFSIQPGPISLKEAMDTTNTLKNVENLGKSIAAFYQTIEKEKT